MSEPSAFGDAVAQLEPLGHKGTHAFQCWDLETGDTAIVSTTPYRLGKNERWSWRLRRPRRIRNREGAAG